MANMENATLRDELQCTSEQVDKAKIELQETKTSMQQSMSSLTEIINSKINGDIRMLEDNLTASQAQNVKDSQELAIIKDNLTVTENKVKQLEEDLSVMTTKQVNSECRINEQCIKIERLLEIKCNSENEINDLKQQLIQLTGKKDELCKVVDKCQADFEIMKENIKARDGYIQALRMELDDAKASIQLHDIEKLVIFQLLRMML